MSVPVVDLTLSDDDPGGAQRAGSHVLLRRRRRPHAPPRPSRHDKTEVVVLDDDDDRRPPVTPSNHGRVTPRSAPGSSQVAYDTNRQMAKSISNGTQEPRNTSPSRTGSHAASDISRTPGLSRPRQRPRDEPNYWKDKKYSNAEVPTTLSPASAKAEKQISSAPDDFRRNTDRTSGSIEGGKGLMAARKSSHQTNAIFRNGRPAHSAVLGESAPRKRKRSSGESLSQLTKPKGPRLSGVDLLDPFKATRDSDPDDSSKSVKRPSQHQPETEIGRMSSNFEAGSHARRSDPTVIKAMRRSTDLQSEAISGPEAGQKEPNGQHGFREEPKQENPPSDTDQNRDRSELQSRTSVLQEHGTFKIPERPASGKPSEAASSARTDATITHPLTPNDLEKQAARSAAVFTSQDEKPEIPLTLSATETLLKRYLNELQDDHENFLRAWLGRARKCYERPTSGEACFKLGEAMFATDLSKGPTKVNQAFVHESSPFASMKSVSARINGKANEKGHVYLTQDVMFDKSTTHKYTRSYLSVQVVCPKLGKLSVPEYTSYVGLKQNVLTENDQKLLYWPYMGENANEAILHEELLDKFHVPIDKRARRLQQSAQSEKWYPYIRDFLAERGCTMNDVLRFLLEPVMPSSVQVTDNVKQAVLARDKSCKEDFNRESKRWVLLLSKLPPSSDLVLARAALACQAFLSVCKFSIWHVARHTIRLESEAQHINDASALKDVDTTKIDFQYRQLACRICHLHNCTYHGEYRESPHSDEDDIDGDARSVGSELSLDLEEASRINFKTLVRGQPRHDHQYNRHTPLNRPTFPRRGYSYWIQKSSTHLIHDREPFYPCSHEGSCEEAQCRCYKKKITCEKTCACPPDCERRFRGCQCAQKGKVCFQNPHCDCYRLNRECDADLCGTCGAAEVLDPVNRYTKEIAKGRCANVHIQRNLPKRTLLGHSEVQGFGLYMGEPVKAHEYIGEYKGEVITKGEADRRGAIYAHLATNYLFSLNKEQEVDSTKAGNKMRFVNNSEREETMNCYAQTMLCNSVARIGMYARRDIAVGEELFFNYGYPKTITKHFWEKGERPKKAHGTNRGKWRASTAVVSDDDEILSTVAIGTGKAAAKKEKYRLDKDGKLVKRKSNAGGARPGAGRKPKNRQPAGVNIGIIPPNPSTSSVSQLKDKGKGKARMTLIDRSPSPQPVGRRMQGSSERPRAKGWAYEVDGDVFEHEDEMAADEDVQAELGAEEEELRGSVNAQDSDEDSEYHDDEEEELPRRRTRRGWRKSAY